MKRWRTRAPAALLAAALSLPGSGPLDHAVDETVAWVGSLTVQPDDVEAARHQLDRILDRVDGRTARERVVLNPSGGLRRTAVVIRVPAEQFDAAMESIADLGTLSDHLRTAEDVAVERADLETDLAHLRAHLGQLEGLLSRVQTTADVASLRAELRTRRAEITRHEQDLSELDRRVALATIRLRLVSEPPASTAVPASPTPADGLWWRLGLAVLLGLTR